MSGIIRFESNLSDEILGLAEYYDVVLSRIGLITKETDFRK
jgi:hypothetical protein